MFTRRFFGAPLGCAQGCRSNALSRDFPRVVVRPGHCTAPLIRCGLPYAIFAAVMRLVGLNSFDWTESGVSVGWEVATQFGQGTLRQIRGNLGIAA